MGAAIVRRISSGVGMKPSSKRCLQSSFNCSVGRCIPGAQIIGPKLFAGVCCTRWQSAVSTVWTVNSRQYGHFTSILESGTAPSSEGGLWSNYQHQQARPPKHTLVSQPYSSPNVRFHRK
ncbi:unnamed protein product, partial [Ectocarpus sp. 12 AP-2014]